MDHLTLMVLEAQRRKMSYGKYAALVYEGLMPPVAVDVPMDSTSVVCRCCGKRFVPHRWSVRYCSEECRMAVQSKRVLARWHEKHDKEDTDELEV